MNTTTLTLGADPELAVLNLTSGAYVPAWEITKGTKEKPEKIAGVKNFFMHSDNVALELNFPTINTEERTFDDVSAGLLRHIENFLTEKGLTYQTIPCCDLYSPETLKHPIAQRFGCDPDFSAYSEVKRPRARLHVENTNTRYFGGHIHVGYDKELCPPNIFVKFMDLLIALPLLPFDKQSLRRKVYGEAGLYREKPYGVEYRTLSNFWITNRQARRLIYQNLIVFVNGLQTHRHAYVSLYSDMNWNQIKTVIDEEDITKAQNIVFKVQNQIAQTTNQILSI